LYHKPAVFHLQWGKGIANWIWVQDFGIKIILSLRGTHITISPIANANLTADYLTYFPRVDGFHAVSNSIKMAAENYGADSSKIKVIYSGLDTEQLPFSSRAVQNEKLEIVSVGRSHWVKGYTYALDAFSQLKNENLNFQYTIIGIENDEELVFQSAQLELGSTVSFQPNQSFQNVVHAIQKADILLLSSVEEGIANVVLEAMALGTIVLSTDCGGMDEVLVDGENGFLVPIRNSKAIAQKIKLISGLSEDEKQLIRIKARATIVSQHSFDRMILEMKELYTTVLNIAD
jgi:colanic acid/amylovoran biosynthesis glycosyltransferase